VQCALGRWQQGKAIVTFAEAEPKLTALLHEFGPRRKSGHPEQPFWRQRRDGVWTVKSCARRSDTDACFAVWRSGGDDPSANAVITLIAE